MPKLFLVSVTKKLDHLSDLEAAAQVPKRGLGHLDAPQELLDLAEEFRFLKKGFRGDLRFYGEPEVFEVADFLEMRTSGPELRME